MTDLTKLSLDALLACPDIEPYRSEITRRFAALTERISELEQDAVDFSWETAIARAEAAEKERDEAREESRLHVECMCGHLVDDHDGECQGFGVGGGGQETECDCQNFRPAWAEWWKRADDSEARVVVLENALREIESAVDAVERLRRIARAALAVRAEETSE